MKKFRNWSLLLAVEAELKICACVPFDLIRDEPTDCPADLEADVFDDTLEPPSAPQEKQIFEGLCFYVNGSTAPFVSDHKLKHLLSAHGARHSITLGRRTVTHVILGTVNANGGCGGALAATKIQKEVTRTGGKAVKYITVEWYVFALHSSCCSGFPAVAGTEHVQCNAY